MRFGLIVSGGLVVVLAGCGGGGGPFAPKGPEAPVETSGSASGGASEGQLRPQARPEGAAIAPKPPANARTAAQFDTVSAEEKQAATQTPADPVGERSLGETVASLGDPSDPGLWLQTPLVKAVQPGRVTLNGKSAKVELRPIDGPATAGSRLSLSAMQLIGAPLTGLPTIEVFAGG